MLILNFDQSSPDWKVLLLLLKFSWESLELSRTWSRSLLRPDPTRSSEKWQKKLNWVTRGKLVWQLPTNCLWSFVPIIQFQLIFIERLGYWIWNKGDDKMLKIILPWSQLTLFLLFFSSSWFPMNSRNIRHDLTCWAWTECLYSLISICSVVVWGSLLALLAWVADVILSAGGISEESNIIIRSQTMYIILVNKNSQTRSSGWL